MAWAPFPLAARSALLAVLLGAGARLSPAAPSPDSLDCASCHDQAQRLAESAHAGLPCQTCHQNHDTFPHPENVPKPVCAACHAKQAGDYAGGVHGQARRAGNEAAPDCSVCHGSAHELLDPKSPAFRTAALDTCGACHAEVVDQFRKSVHGQALAHGIADAPLCTDCHGEHRIVRHTETASPVNAAHIRETCGSCHGNVRLARKFGMPSDRLVSFDASFHGLAAKAGSQTVANCASCHGVHNILASSDPDSTVNPKNLPKTCGQCHPGAGERFAISQVHLVSGGGEPPALRWVRWFYVPLIFLTIGLMLAHNAGDWIRKLIRLRFGGPAPIAPVPKFQEPRMLPFERLQHAVLAISFIGLAVTGFALKYPDQWWTRPILLLEGSRSIRGLAHRVAAVVFLAVAVTHLISLIASRRLRKHWEELLPEANDAREAASRFAYNLGLRSEPGPRAKGGSPHNYVAKLEYWAVIWGSAVMASTGLLLWANNLALRLLPKIALDVASSIHFYEAVLAVGAIVAWHFYFVIFDPDVYPLDTAFLTGGDLAKRTPSSTGDAFVSTGSEELSGEGSPTEQSQSDGSSILL
jgi:cytochrome b subunit of formate dehydrogenase